MEKIRFLIITNHGIISLRAKLQGEPYTSFRFSFGMYYGGKFYG